MKDRLQPLNDLLEGIQANGRSGLVQTLARMIGEDNPSAECISETDACMDAAGSNEDYWGCAIDMARCLISVPIDEAPEFEVDPQPPTPPPPPPTPPPPPPTKSPGLKVDQLKLEKDESVAVVVLAALIVHLRGYKTS